MVLNCRVRIGSAGMDRLAGACKAGGVAWQDAVRWVNEEAERAAQAEALAAIERAAMATPEQWAVMRPAISWIEPGAPVARGHNHEGHEGHEK